MNYSYTMGGAQNITKAPKAWLSVLPFTAFVKREPTNIYAAKNHTTPTSPPPPLSIPVKTLGAAYLIIPLSQGGFEVFVMSRGGGSRSTSTKRIWRRALPPPGRVCLMVCLKIGSPIVS